MKATSKRVKRWIGKGLFHFCNAVPRTKPWLRRWGLRTSKEWFADQIARAQMPDGRTLKLVSAGENYLSFELFWRGTGYYEPITTMIAEELACSADTFIDVGANIGFYSLILASRHSQLPVISFEPNPKLHALVQGNVEANRLAKVRCEPLAVSDRNGTATLYLNQSDMSASLESDFDDNQAGTVRIQTTTLDDYLETRRIAGRLLIKVDVEGHEAAFFRGARDTITALKPDIIAEVAEDYDEGATAFLRENGYRFCPITDRGLIESPGLSPVVRGPFVFLNCLLTTKTAEETARLFQRIEGQVGKLDLLQTSKHVDSRAREQMKRRQSTHTPETACTPGLRLL